MSDELPTTAETTKPPRRKRWVPLSLQLFVAMLMLLFVVGLLWVWLPYHREQQVAEMVKAWNGHFITKTRGPKWLRQLVGEDRIKEFKVFERADHIILTDSKVSDAEILQLSRLVTLERLVLDYTSVTDAGVAHLSKLPNLEHLSLTRTAVTDAGLIHLSELKNLKVLFLWDCKGVTDAGLVHLRGLTNLKSIILNNTRVTDAGLVHLGRMTTLRHISITGTAITSTGILQLATSHPGIDIGQW